MNNQKRDNVAWFLLLVVWSVGLCAGFRLPHNKLSSYRNELRQMAYNGSMITAVLCGVFPHKKEAVERRSKPHEMAVIIC